jgi:hypothetical protein
LKIYVINQTGAAPKNQQKKDNTMLFKKKRKKTRKRAVKSKARVSRKRAVARRKNPARKKAKARNRHRPVVYSFGKGKNRTLKRSPWMTLTPRRINPKKKRRIKRRRNPNIKAMTKRIFNKNIFMNALLLLAGIGGAGSLKKLALKMAPAGMLSTVIDRGYGVLSIALGLMVAGASKRKETKTVSTGMIAYGVYDLITANIPAVSGYLPSITAPSAMSGYSSYGRRVMGSNFSHVSPMSTEIVGASISAGVIPEIVGGDMDLADMLDMSC